MELTKEEALNLIDRIGPHIDSRYDLTYAPVFPEGRTDVCAVKRMAENGTSFGYDTLYLVWKKADGKIHYQEIDNSRATKDYLHIESIIVAGDTATVQYRSGGSFSGQAWTRDLSVLLE